MRRALEQALDPSELKYGKRLLACIVSKYADRLARERGEGQRPLQETARAR
jgi:hypothetical protein